MEMKPELKDENETPKEVIPPPKATAQEVSDLTEIELRALLEFLARVNLKGSEAKTLVHLQTRLEQLAETCKVS